MLPSFVADAIAPAVVTVVAALVVKAAHDGMRALATYLENKTNDAKRKAAIEHVLAVADNVVTALEQTEKPALIAAAGGLLSTGKLPAGVGDQLKAKGCEALTAQAPGALATLQEVEGMSTDALNQFVGHAIEAAAAKQ
jgi:hypothetical protein